MSGSVRSRSLRRLPLTAASLVTGAYNAATRGQLYVHNLHWSITPGQLEGKKLTTTFSKSILYVFKGGLFSYFGRFGKVQGVHLPIVSLFELVTFSIDRRLLDFSRNLVSMLLAIII